MHSFTIARMSLQTCALQALALPSAVAAEVEMASLMLRAQPFTDADALLPICYRCQATNALLNTQVCTYWFALITATTPSWSVYVV